MGNDWFHEYFINELKAIRRKNASKLSYEVVDSLPPSGEENIIYFVKSNSGSSNNHYDEYAWVSSSSAFEKIGSTQVDGSSANPDWNQNDATQSDYVKNRPFYTGDPVETVLVEESTVAFTANEGIMVATWPENFDLVDGQTYCVSWDGTDYVCTGIVFRGTMPTLGNLAIAGAGDDTGEPFVFINQGQWLVASTDSATEHVIGIKITTISIVQIDEKYLPEATNIASGIAKIQVRNLDTTKSYSTEDVEEIYQSVRAGAAIYLTNGEVITRVAYSPNNRFTFELSNGIKTTVRPVDGVWDFTNKETTYPDSIAFGAYYTNYANISCSLDTGVGGIKASGHELVNTNMAGFRGKYIQADDAIVLKFKNSQEYLYIKANTDGEINVIKRRTGQASGGDITTLFKNGDDSMILKSSTEGSTKKFKITMDDNSSLKVVNTSGSSEVTMAKTSDIPTDDHIKELINTALSKIGVAEEGAY